MTIELDIKLKKIVIEKMSFNSSDNLKRYRKKNNIMKAGNLLQY